MEEPVRVRVPRENETIGIIEEVLPGTKVRVRCSDGKMRLCRVPGRYRRKIWLRVGEYVLVEPWKIQGESRGDIIWSYKKAQIEWLKRKGFLEGLVIS